MINSLPGDSAAATAQKAEGGHHVSQQHGAPVGGHGALGGSNSYGRGLGYAHLRGASSGMGLGPSTAQILPAREALLADIKSRQAPPELLRVVPSS